MSWPGWVAGVALMLGAACTEPRDLDAVVPPCGDGVVQPGEGCDDGNREDRDGCSATCRVEFGFACEGAPSQCRAVCGDGRVRARESCDDGGERDGDGCSATCLVEWGWSCDDAEPSQCEPSCGDGLLRGNEACDDGNRRSGDGCDRTCRVEPGFVCETQVAPSVCRSVCGDGLVVGNEACDDQNREADDGCGPDCEVEDGFSCSGSPSVCVRCGNARLEGPEECDDGGRVPGDGCDRGCLVELGWTCDEESPTRCAPICGDGRTLGDEACDDGNLDPGDGCDPSCEVEEGWRCEQQRGETSSCRTRWTAFEAPVNLSGRNAGAWTGREMVVFGGGEQGNFALDDGQAFDPETRTWRRIASEGAPAPRLGHSAAWSGEAVLFFGGLGPERPLADGGAYDPDGDSWVPIPAAPGPGRSGHLAVWTGRRMLVVGGSSEEQFLGDGLLYDPAAGTWTRTAALSVGRIDHAGAWTGRELIVHGGFGIVDERFSALGDAWAYDPGTNRWRPLPPAPLSARANHRAVFTGTEVVFFGGGNESGAVFADGARFDPVAERWTLLPRSGGPTARTGPGLAFGDGQLFVASDAFDGTIGATWRVGDAQWRAITPAFAPFGLSNPLAAWTGQQLLLVGGGTAALFEPPADP